jgi:hypothetical protein
VTRCDQRFGVPDFAEDFFGAEVFFAVDVRLLPRVAALRDALRRSTMETTPTVPKQKQRRNR